MSTEVALVFDKEGKTLHWHLPPGVSNNAIPDSRSLWEVAWENRFLMGGIIHTHPWNGEAWYSGTDVTTWAAMEKGLGQRYWWPVATFTDLKLYHWVGPEELSYAEIINAPIRVDELDKLRELSR